MTSSDRTHLFRQLRQVSRAFYLTLRVLPRGLREPVGLAYLLARAADTVADTRAVEPRRRLAGLAALRAAVVSGGTLEAPGLDERATGWLAGLPDADRARVRDIVTRLIDGMGFDLETFPAEDAGRVVALGSEAELDRYTYLVAGCVGEFWTEMSAAHVPAFGRRDRASMVELGVGFGKALQWTNILRDVPADLRIGRCYLPGPALRELGLEPADLLSPGASDRARPLLERGIGAALEHYEAAERYVLETPTRCVRLRLAALWPLLIGLGTLSELGRNRRWLDPAARSKVSRGEVYRIVAWSLPAVCSSGLLRGTIARRRAAVSAAARPTAATTGR